MHSTPAYTAIIVDDEIKPAEALQMKLADIEPDLHVVALCSSANALPEKFLVHEPDIVFLDIEMPGKTGLELIDIIKTKDRKVEVIVTTAYNNFDYIQKALRSDAADYLIKPIMKDELKQAVARAKMKLHPVNGHAIKQESDSRSDGQQYTFNCATGKLLLKLSQIVYIKAEGNYCRFYLKDGSNEIVTEMMKNLETVFAGSSLIRVDRSHIINKTHVQKITTNSCMCYFDPETKTRQIELTSRGIKALF